MRKFLNYIKISCADCGYSQISGGGVFSYKIGKIFSEDQVPQVVRSLRCQKCSSSKINCHSDQGRSIIRSGRSRVCTNCSGYIPDKFIELFPKSNFCPHCILSELISDDIATKSLRSKKYANGFRGLASYIGKYGIEKHYWIKKQADMNDAASAYEYAWHLSESKHNEYLEIAEKYFQLSIKLYDSDDYSSDACVRYAYLLLKPYYKNNDSEKAISLLTQAAKAGNRSASETLGEMYYYGDHVGQDFETSFMYFKKAISESYPFRYLQLTLWIMYWKGIGVAKDTSIAADYLRDAIESYCKNWDVDEDELFLQCTDAANGIDIGNIKNNYARTFFDLSLLRSPFRNELLARCGGKIERNFEHIEIVVFKIAPRNASRFEKIWTVKSRGAWTNSDKDLGQIERLDGKWWLAVDSNGIPLNELYLKFRDAIKALGERDGKRLPIRMIKSESNKTLY